MKSKLLGLLLLIAFSSMHFSVKAAGGDPWTPQQLLEPAELAKTINNAKAAKPIIFSVGMQAIVKGSIDIGPTVMPENMTKLKQQLVKLPKNAPIVIYCGCCPFSRCPNIRPAMELLGSLKFTDYKLLNIPQNIKVDWIDHGYPMSE